MRKAQRLEKPFKGPPSASEGYRSQLALRCNSLKTQASLAYGKGVITSDIERSEAKAATGLATSASQVS